MFQGRTYVPTADASAKEWLLLDHKSETSGGKMESSEC